MPFPLFCVNIFWQSETALLIKTSLGSTPVRRLLGLATFTMLDKKLKQRIINKFRIHDNDTGSSQVQIAILSEEIKQLTDHLKMHKGDYSSRRGLLRKVGERRRLLKYLQREDEKAFLELADKLKLKIAKKMIEDEDARKAEEAALFAEANLEDEEVETEEVKAEDDK